MYPTRRASRFDENGQSGEFPSRTVFERRGRGKWKAHIAHVGSRYFSGIPSGPWAMKATIRPIIIHHRHTGDLIAVTGAVARQPPALLEMVLSWCDVASDGTELGPTPPRGFCYLEEVERCATSEPTIGIQ